MYTLNDIGRQVNRPVVYLRGLQQRFELYVPEDTADYSKKYLAFIVKIVHLRQLGINEETLVKMWKLEKKLLQLLHVDDAPSPTWYLDSSGRKTRRKQRLLLTNYDIGVNLSFAKLQLGMSFKENPSELFNGHEMGEDALSVLERYLTLYRKVCADSVTESRQLASAAGWGRCLRVD